MWLSNFPLAPDHAKPPHPNSTSFHPQHPLSIKACLFFSLSFSLSRFGFIVIYYFSFQNGVGNLFSFSLSFSFAPLPPPKLSPNPCRQGFGGRRKENWGKKKKEKKTKWFALVVKCVVWCSRHSYMRPVWTWSIYHTYRTAWIISISLEGGGGGWGGGWGETELLFSEKRKNLHWNLLDQCVCVWPCVPFSLIYAS